MSVIYRFILSTHSAPGAEDVLSTVAEYEVGERQVDDTVRPVVNVDGQWVRQFRIDPVDGELYGDFWDRALQEAKAYEGIE